MDRFTSENGRMYRKYRVNADLLCLGDRMRGSVFRPCLDVLPATTLEGALRARFPQPDRCVYPIGRIIQARKEALVYSPRDRVAGVSKVPIQAELLTSVEAEVYVLLNDWTVRLPERFELFIGALRAQGCGRTAWEVVEDRIPAGNPVQGALFSRIPDTEKWREAFGITNVHSARLGYLPIPERGARTYYQRALFEGSVVHADAIAVLQEGRVASSVDAKPPTDPLASVLGDITQERRGMKDTTLHAAGQVLARYGYAIARLYLEDRRQIKAKDQVTVSAALRALEVLESREPTRSHPELGAFVLRKLEAVMEWKRMFGADQPQAAILEPLRDGFGEALQSAGKEMTEAPEFERASIRGKFAHEIGDAVALYGVEEARRKLKETARRWAERRAQGQPTKGQPEENVAMADRALELLLRREILAQHPNVARLLLRRTLVKQSKTSKNQSNRRRNRRR